MNKVFVISYQDKNNEEPTVTVFSEENAAKSCFDFFKNNHARCWMDEVPVYSKFNIK